jgi:antitoxin PrlF
MPSVSSKGQVTIPKSIREDLGIGPGDEVEFERTPTGYVLRKTEPTAEDGRDPFEKYRGAAASDDTMSDRMKRLRGEFPREVDAGDHRGGDE